MNTYDPVIADALEGRLGKDAQRIADTGMEWIALMIRKNLDYGGSVWNIPSLADGLDAGMAIRVRMSDKIQRLQSLLSVKQPGTQMVADESIDDTIRDLGAYCLLYLARPKSVDKDLKPQE